jgi:syntaxin-binding protein 1
MQRNGLLPATPNCDLVLLDRSLDPVAPFVHDWTYEALVYDLLSVEDKAIRWVWVGGVYVEWCVGG